MGRIAFFAFDLLLIVIVAFIIYQYLFIAPVSHEERIRQAKAKHNRELNALRQRLEEQELRLEIQSTSYYVSQQLAAVNGQIKDLDKRIKELDDTENKGDVQTDV